MRPQARRSRPHAARGSRAACLARAASCLAALATLALLLRALRRLRAVGSGSGFAAAPSFAGRGVAAAFPSASLPPPPPPPAAGAAPPLRRIPRTVHQTLPDAHAPPAHAAAALASWRAVNPGWEVRRYGDADAAAFVAAEFPQYAPAYAALPAAVSRADFFRILVLLRHGGVYADVDAAAAAPLDALLTAGDSLVVCWENAFHTAAEAYERHYVRQRQARRRRTHTRPACACVCMCGESA
jgi:hypothetical protein